MDLQTAALAFITVCTSIRKLSPHTVRAYALDLASFASFVGTSVGITGCDRATVQRYVQYLFDVRHLKESSVKRHLATLRSFFRWIEDDSDTFRDPLRTLKLRIRSPKRLPRIIPRADLRLLLGRTPANARTLRDLTSDVAAELLFATGMRVSELASVTDAAIDLSDGVITILGKGNRQRRVFVPAELNDLLREYRARRSGVGSTVTTFLVNSRGHAASPEFIRRLIRSRAEGANLRKRITPHMFRHSVATYLLEEGVDIRHVQQLLGHRSIATTETYTHVADASLRVRITERHPRKTILAGK